VGQPAEEVVKGAAAMLDDHLYERFGRPACVLALHESAGLGAGKIGYTPGYFMASADSVNLTVRGVGGHGAAPQSTKDPVVLAAQIILALQTIVSREDSPLDPVVVTVGSIHGGTKRNIIPNEVQLLMTVRTYKPEVRKRVLASIERIAKGLAIAAGVPENLAPVMEPLPGESIGSTYNDPGADGAAGLRAEAGDWSRQRREDGSADGERGCQSLQPRQADSTGHALARRRRSRADCQRQAATFSPL
jgi:Metal-dependent amidase/aminoacylase/carboxypeptidase